MASYILHRTTHPPCRFHSRKKKWISYSIKQCELSTWITLKWHFMNSVHSITPVFKNTARLCLAVLLLLLDHPNHKYARILFLLSWLSIKGFIWTFHQILLFLYGWFYLSINSLSLSPPLSLCTQSSLDYYDCEEKVSVPPGTPAWLAPQMIQARV